MNNINDKKFNTGIEEIRKVQMTSLEKNQIRESILGVRSKSPKPIKSLWMISSWMSVSHTRRLFSYVAISCLILIIAGREVVFASEVSLPGDTLYPVKVSIIEPINSALKSSSVAKARYESSLATKRMEEAEKLARENKLDESKEKKINDLLEHHTKEIGIALTSVDEDTSSDDVDDIVINFQAGMNAHARVLDIIDSRKSNSEIKNNKISEKARDNGVKVRSALKREKNNTESYAKRKDKVQSLISSTSVNIESIDGRTSPVRESVITTTNTTLENAKKLLDDANREDQSEDSDRAYSSLLDSESSAKEADIFLNVGLKLNGDDNNDSRDRKWKDDSRGRRNRDDRKDSNNDR